jgi:carbonic anhydrase
MKILFPSLLLISLTWSCREPAEPEYAAPEDGVGKSQSPINIVTTDAQPKQDENIFAKLHANVKAAENLGHTVELAFSESSTDTIEGKTCTAKQLHFHTPSEHLIDGVTYPMEMHIVSTIKDGNEEKEPNYIVVGILFKMGKENRFLKEFENLIPAEEGEHVVDSGAVNLEDLLTQIAADHPLSCFTYNGSLTTAPYSERVNWIVLSHPIEASPAQIMAIEKKEGNNARHVQAIYDRVVAMH